MSFKDLVKMEGGVYHVDFDTPLDQGEWMKQGEVVRLPFSTHCNCGRALEPVIESHPGVMHITFECPVCEKRS